MTTEIRFFALKSKKDCIEVRTVFNVKTTTTNQQEVQKLFGRNFETVLNLTSL